MKFRFGVLTIVLSVLFVVFFVVFFESCGKRGKSFKQYKKEEQQAINDLIAKEGFEILNKYPANGVFGEKQFVKLDNECYLNVLDSGNGHRADSSKTIVLMRCSYIGIVPQDSSYRWSIFPNGFKPLEFVYGKMNEAKYIASQSSYNEGYLYLSPGVESALKYVGEHAVVRMIIPFDNGQSTKYPLGIGSAYQDEMKIPMYLDKVKFVFDED